MFYAPIKQVISARKGEFETGYERGGQTREHVQLAKTLGVAKLLVVVNKMDEPTVQWSKERFSHSLAMHMCMRTHIHTHPLCLYAMLMRFLLLVCH